MQKDKGFWIGMSLLNVSVVALYGLLLRSKIIFPIPFLDYRNLLSAHSYYALAGWVGLALITLLTYDVLPQDLSQKKIYRKVLWGIQFSATGMGLSFPFLGYHAIPVFFSSFYILVTFVFGWIFFNDLWRADMPTEVRWLSLCAVGSLLLSATGVFGLFYILFTQSGNSRLYRDAFYSFLHLQYNGFFTLAIFALLFSQWKKKTGSLPPVRRFSRALILSVIPSLFVALLWHNLFVFYMAAAIGCLLILFSLFYFLPIFRSSLDAALFQQPLVRTLWIASAVSFLLKMLLTTGTLYPSLSNAVYGARPVIIGFLHLVFLGFVSFYILAHCLQEGFFICPNRKRSFPFIVFGTGVFANETFLMLQGLGILFRTNSPVYNWLLWGGAILLFAGSLWLAILFYQTRRQQKKAATSAATFS